jgi:hypothetical protein
MSSADRFQLTLEARTAGAVPEMEHFDEAVRVIDAIVDQDRSVYQQANAVTLLNNTANVREAF